MVVGEICLFQGYIVKKDMILIGSNTIVLRVRGEKKGKGGKLSDLTDFGVEGKFV